MPVALTRLLGYWHRVRGSYWFIPSVMTLAAAALSAVTVEIDRRLGISWVEDVWWVNVNKPEGARVVLSTIAGSMITVAGVTFSVTIAAIATTSSQYGPRLLTNFMHNFGNQVTLGTFIATFMFCVLVLRTIQSEGEANGAFVPHIAIFGGVMFGVASLAVLIYFIHHVPRSISVPVMTAGIGEELIRHIDGLFPTGLGWPAPDEPTKSPPPDDRKYFVENGAEIGTDARGYLQYIDEFALMRIARRSDLVVVLVHQPGDFAVRGKPLAHAWPKDRITSDVVADLKKAFVWGHQRTFQQDVMFLVDELVEISIRALSPGVNDAFTAVNCMHWLGYALQAVVERDTPDPCRYDEDGKLRFITRPVTALEMIDGVCDGLRPSAQADRLASLTLMEVIANVIECTRASALVAELRLHADALMEGCEISLKHPRDVAAVRAAYEAAKRTNPSDDGSIKRGRAERSL